MIAIKFNTPILESKHWENIRQITAQTIKNSLPHEMRETLKEIFPDIEPEDLFGCMMGKIGESDKEYFFPRLHDGDNIPQDIRDVLLMYYLGSHEYYCRENNLL